MARVPMRCWIVGVGADFPQLRLRVSSPPLSATAQPGSAFSLHGSGQAQAEDIARRRKSARLQLEPAARHRDRSGESSTARMRRDARVVFGIARAHASPADSWQLVESTFGGNPKIASPLHLAVDAMPEAFISMAVVKCRFRRPSKPELFGGETMAWKSKGAGRRRDGVMSVAVIVLTRKIERAGRRQLQLFAHRGDMDEGRQ